MLDDVLKKWGGYEVSAMDVYTDMFKLGQGYIQREGEPSGEFKANPIAYYRTKDKDKGHFRVMFEDTFEEVLGELQEADDFAILNGISYFGRRNLQSHASKMFAMIFDLDGVTEKTLNAFLSGATVGGAYPVPNYIVLSGHGVHLYYVFEEPLPLFPYTKVQLKELKYALTEKIWNPYTSTEEKPQVQGINQGFRVIGGKTKEDAPEQTVRAFRVNAHPFSLSQLCEYVPVESRVDESKLWRERKYTLEQAKKKFPEWYEKVIVNGDTSRKYWDIAGKVHGDNPYALYDWWKRQILEGASYKHRYFAIMCLAIYGAKNDKPYEEVREDAFGFVPFLNSLNPDEPFTEKDCEVALECYDARYKTFPIKDIKKISGISFKRNNRHSGAEKAPRKLTEEMRARREEIKRAAYEETPNERFARLIIDDEIKQQGLRSNLEVYGWATRDQKYQRGEWRNKDGRPKGSPNKKNPKKEQIAEYVAAHPEASVTEIARELGISRTTVYKWWK